MSIYVGASCYQYSVVRDIMAKVAVSASALIAAVKRNPILWDSREDSYKLSENKPAIWQQIAEELGSDRRKYRI
jgi:hypothetical protein